MPVTDWFSSQRPCKRFQTHQQLFDGLAALDDQAILCLQTTALPMVRRVSKNMGLNREQAEDVLNQSTLIFLRKIEEGTYEFKGHAPTTYLVEVAKRLAMSVVRRKKPASVPLEDHHYQHYNDHQELERQRASAELVRRFLAQMGKACAQVIRLHHLDGYSDQEVIKEGITPYSTVNSLKMKRSTCMKKLIEIAQKWKTSTSI